MSKLLTDLKTQFSHSWSWEAFRPGFLDPKTYLKHFSKLCLYPKQAWVTNLIHSYPTVSGEKERKYRPI